MDDKKTLNALQDGLAAYETIVDKEIHYVYLKKNEYHELIFKPHKRNFMHLCGVDYFDPKTRKKVNAMKFYSTLKAKKLSIKGIVKKGSADQKLQIINQLKDLTSCNIRIIDEKTTYLNFVFHGALRSRKQIFALALEHENTGHFVPMSLLNLKSNSKGNTIKKGYEVQCIYSVDFKTKDFQLMCYTPEFASHDQTNTYPYRTPLKA